MTYLHRGVLSDQDQALDTFWSLHCHYGSDLSPQTVAKEVGFFDSQSIESIQHGLGHLGSVESGVLCTGGFG